MSKSVSTNTSWIFIAAEKRLILEIDGAVHYCDNHSEADRCREERLRSLGFSILRVTNEEVKTSIDGVLLKILQQLQ